jgi:uncharacterized protein (UPF0332 family)
VSDEQVAVVRYRPDRARHALTSAEHLAAAGEWNDCVNRLYYACFYAASALLLSRGLTASKHTGLRALLNRHVIRAGLLTAEAGDLFNELFDWRQRADYRDLVFLNAADVEPWIPRVRDFVQHCDELLEADVEAMDD